jgi:hypothetical protein
MKKYTVLVEVELDPGHWIAWVEADNPQEAEEEAIEKIADENDFEPDELVAIEIFSGHHKSLRS